MQHPLLRSVTAAICLLVGLLQAASIQAAPAPADTVRGHQRFVRHVAQSACEKLLEEGQHYSLSTLTAAQSDTLLGKIMDAAMNAHSEEMSTILQANKLRNERNIRKFGEEVGRDVAFTLLRECPGSQHLLGMLGFADLKDKMQLQAAERPVLSLVSAEICQRLDTENTKSAIATRTAAERTQLLETTMQGGMLKHIEALAGYYGLDAMQRKATAEAIGQKVAVLMAELCPNYLLLFGIDKVKR